MPVRSIVATVQQAVLLFIIPPDSSISLCLHHVYMYVSELSVSLLVLVKDRFARDVKIGRKIPQILTSQRFRRGVVDHPIHQVTENQLYYMKKNKNKNKKFSSEEL